MAIAATPLRGAGIDPRQLVLQQAEVPAGFALDPAASRYWPNAAFARGRPTLKQLVDRSGRVTGYQRLYKDPVGARVQYILSGVDVFRAADGASTFLSWTDQERRKTNAARVKRGDTPSLRARAAIGAQSWIYADGPPAYHVLVIWRQSRVFASIHSWGIGARQTLELARVQRHRIVSRLR